MLRGKNHVSNFVKISIISISLIVSAYGCGSSPTSDQGGTGLTGSNFTLPPQLQAFMEFALGAVAMLDGAGSLLPGNIQDSLANLGGGVQGSGVQGQAISFPDLSNLDFTDFNSLLNGIPFRVNGSIDKTDENGQTTNTMDLTFSYCPNALPGFLPTNNQNNVNTTSISDLTCTDEVEPVDVHIVGTLVTDDETGNIIDGNLAINDQELFPMAFCDFGGNIIADILTQFASLSDFCSAP